MGSSMESRWVAGDFVVSHDEDFGRRSFESVDEIDDDDENNHGGRLKQRLIRTSPKYDAFDVDALVVPGVQRNDSEEITWSMNLTLTLQTLGFVFGGVGISPLYTFNVIIKRSSIDSHEDVLGALSLVIYTLILITFVKYALVVLWANDDGEGGTFALYSLICRNAKVSLLPNQLPSDDHISIFGLKVPSSELERSIKTKQFLEKSPTIKKLLLFMVLIGTSMMIALGVVTPAMSVMTAVSGLRVGIDSVNQDKVVLISVAFLIVLFSIQRFGNSKVGLAVGPALLLWFCSLGGIGFYNVFKYGTMVFKAFNPLYILYYFTKDSFKAWTSLGGCLLCATGSEAMFSDLGYFPVRSVQLTFVFLVLPCLLLGYLGQAAYLLENYANADQIFYSSIPKDAFWPVVIIANIAALIASRTMISATFSCIKQSTALGCFPRLKIIHTSRKLMGQIYVPVINWFLLVFCVALVTSFGNTIVIGNAYVIAELGVMMITTVLVTIIMLLIWQNNIVFVLMYLFLFLGLELVFLSSALGSVGDGSWVSLAFATVLFLIMYIWNYGIKLKYETEVKQKLSMDLMMKLGCNLGTVRAPGVGILYNELVKDVPAIFGQFLTILPAIHSMIIFVCIKHVPVPFVPQNERFLFMRVCPKNYHMFRCIARYGYKDARDQNHQAFQQLLIESLEKFIHREAQEILLETDEEDNNGKREAEARTRVLISPTGNLYSFDVPLLSSFNTHDSKLSSAPSTSFQGTSNDLPQLAVDGLERELFFIQKAKETGVVYLIGHGDIRARKDSWFIKKLVINYLYAFLRRNCRKGTATLNVPHNNLIQVGMQHMV